MSDIQKVKSDLATACEREGYWLQYIISAATNDMPEDVILGAARLRWWRNTANHLANELQLHKDAEAGL